MGTAAALPPKKQYSAHPSRSGQPFLAYSLRQNTGLYLLIVVGRYSRFGWARELRAERSAVRTLLVGRPSSLPDLFSML